MKLAASTHRRSGLILVMSLAFVGAGGCGGSSDEASPSESAAAPSDGAVTAETMVFNGESIPSCESLIGQPTEDVANHFQDGPCGEDVGLDDLQALVPGLGSEECIDGTFLYWNDTGWGATGGKWAEGSLPPAETIAACRGE